MAHVDEELLTCIVVVVPKGTPEYAAKVDMWLWGTSSGDIDNIDISSSGSKAEVGMWLHAF